MVDDAGKGERVLVVAYGWRCLRHVESVLEREGHLDGSFDSGFGDRSIVEVNMASPLLPMPPPS